MRNKILVAIAIIALVIAAAMLLTKPAELDGKAPFAALQGDTLEKIRQTGTIVLGHRESSVPFSYYDDEGKVVGYSQDLAQFIVEAVKKELKLENLTVKLVPVSPKNRFDLVRSGAIDLECGSTGNTTERQKIVAFSNSFFVARMQLMTRKDYDIHDFADLAGKRVVTTAGTTSVGVIEKMNADQKMGMTILTGDDHRDSFLLLESKQADAFVIDDVLLNGERTRAIRWGDWIVTGTPHSRQAYACVLRKEDPAFKRVVDQALAAVMLSGEAEKIYSKWFLSPIPPKGVNLNLNMSEDVANLFKQPNDRAYE